MSTPCHFIGKIHKHFIHSAMMPNKLRNPSNYYFHSYPLFSNIPEADDLHLFSLQKLPDIR